MSVWAAGVWIMMVLLGAGCYWSVRLAYADALFRANTVDSLARAVRLAPGNARYHAWRAQLLEYEGQRATAALQTAAALNPWDSTVWIRLALDAEADGDARAAEKYLLQAAHYDKLFAPRWALMNFYFRSRNPERFWHWAAKALEMSYGDRTAWFQLCRGMPESGAHIPRLLGLDRRLLGEYLRFMGAERDWQASIPVARTLAGVAAAQDTPALLAACDELLKHQTFSDALDVWNILCRRKLVPYEPLDAAAGVSLSNGDFNHAPLQAGFDWRAAATPEASAALLPDGVRFTISGRQPERCELLARYVPLVPGKRYRLSFEYRTEGPGPTGIRWNVDPGLLPANASWQRGEVLFRAPSEFARLSLDCERQPGAARFAGVFYLRHVRLEWAP